ncbi:hypothetical protein Fcan01_26247 [Folsomia candida]|uniref:Uncharacterized protein n=1 Tax=Folsomia candida TaxID=158441 RepID=A0A226D027_FOLCA|nr:hypothetical protein Fcan01_26247 [Folsomia candida]
MVRSHLTVFLCWTLTVTVLQQKSTSHPINLSPNQLQTNTGEEASLISYFSYQNTVRRRKKRAKGSGAGDFIPKSGKVGRFPSSAIFTRLLPFNVNPFTLGLKPHNNATAIANASTISGRKAAATAVSRRGGHVISTASVLRTNGSASARAVSTGGGDKRGDNLAVASAQGKHVISSASSDALTAADADNDMEVIVDPNQLKSSVDKDFSIVDEQLKSRKKRAG